MSIYENPKEYAGYCHISLELATERCKYYLHKIELAEKVVCPECGSHNLCFDNDGSDYSLREFISCTECWEAFDTDDERLKNWVQNEREFDEILWFSNDISQYGIKSVEKEIRKEWTKFVEDSTNKLQIS